MIVFFRMCRRRRRRRHRYCRCWRWDNDHGKLHLEWFSLLEYIALMMWCLWLIISQLSHVFFTINPLWAHFSPCHNTKHAYRYVYVSRPAHINRCSITNWRLTRVTRLMMCFHIHIVGVVVHLMLFWCLSLRSIYSLVTRIAKSILRIFIQNAKFSSVKQWARFENVISKSIRIVFSLSVQFSIINRIHIDGNRWIDGWIGCVRQTFHEFDKNKNGMSGTAAKCFV